MPTRTRASIEKFSSYAFNGAFAGIGMTLLVQRFSVPVGADNYLSDFVMMLWAMAIVFGGVCGLVGLVFDRIRLEAISSMAATIAFFVFGMVIGISRGWDGLALGILLAAFFVSQAYKAWMLTKLAKESENIA